MEIGLSIFPTTDSIHPVRLGKEAEARGFESLFFIEHTHIPASRKTPYPLGGDLPSIYWQAYDPFVALAQVAAVTTQLRVGTGICLVPEHHPLALAKRIASLDSLSNGRFLFGIGAGWNAEELENHGVRFKDRWAVTRESILAMKEVWTKKDAAFHGKHVGFDAVWSEPKPVQKPHPPILIGASSRQAVERVAEYADGWMPIMGSCDLKERLKELEQACVKRSRDFRKLDVSVFAAPTAPGELDKLAKLGVRRVILPLPTQEESKILAILDRYAPLVANRPR
ncbi:MAG TPA: LLM class F420-dependent oxidoreductase [Myxococcota bacterium]|nr:LLM class F420-dependent oxidoreductase [Myxococcota bacterium]